MRPEDYSSIGLVAVAVERREGARAYVTGARDTSQGVPVLPRFLLIPTTSAGEEAGEHQGAAFRTSALAALRSLAGATNM